MSNLGIKFLTFEDQVVVDLWNNLYLGRFIIQTVGAETQDKDATDIKWYPR